MTRAHASKYVQPKDIYAAYRCVNCRHLRYRGEKPGDPCRFCSCADHRLPDEVEDGAADA